MRITIRAAIDAALSDRAAAEADARGFGDPLTDDEWVLLDTRRLVAAIERNTRSPAQAARWIWDTRRAYATPWRRRRTRDRRAASPAPRVPPPYLTHQQALAELLRWDVETDAQDRSGVARFRREVLHGRLLARRDVEAWVKQRATREGPPTIVADPMRGRSVVLLPFGTADGGISHVAITRGGVLDRLRQIVDGLVRAYGWQPAEAATYVLAGGTPALPALQGQIQRHLPLRARSRIVLTIDPTCTPAEVTRAYRRLRHQHFGWLRRLTPKHAALAVWAFRFRDRPIAEQLARWNAQAPRRDQYARASRFRRDSRQALRRLAELGGPRVA
jgi:hypothetical protein